jgi:hypothetical protein
VSEPANVPGVIAVSATTRSGGLWFGSARGPEIALAAPGERIVGAAPPAKSTSGYSIGDGTSGAGAIVSGVAALIRAKYPRLNAANVINRLIRTAKDLGPPGRDDDFGYGLVDPVAALTAPVPEVSQNPLLGSSRATPSPGRRMVRKDDEPAISIGVTDTRGAIARVGVFLAMVVVGLVVLIVYLVRRSGRRAPAARMQQWPPGWNPSAGPPGWPGQPPPGPPGAGGWPPGQAPPPGTHRPPGSGLRPDGGRCQSVTGAPLSSQTLSLQRLPGSAAS